MSQLKRLSLFFIAASYFYLDSFVLAADEVKAKSCRGILQATVVSYIPHNGGEPPLPETFGKRKVNDIPLQIAEKLKARLNDLHQTLNLDQSAQFAINYHGSKLQAEILSRGLTKEQNQRLLNEIKSRKIIVELEGLPAKMRSRYFLVTLPAKDSLEAVEIRYIFSWEFDPAVKGHLYTGFGETETAYIKPIKLYVPSKNAKVRKDIIEKGQSQLTGATCGLAAFCQVLNGRDIPAHEWELIEKLDPIRSAIEVVASKDPGLTLNQLVEVMTSFEHRTKNNLHFEKKRVDETTDIQEFRKHVALASDKAHHIDVIVNYWSPTIGREGGGHFVPIAGYDPVTDFVLINETNRVFNASFWISLTQLYKSITTENDIER